VGRRPRQATGAILAGLIAASLLAPAAVAHAHSGLFGVGLARKPSSHDLFRMRQAKIRSVRLSLDWRSVEPTPGGFDFGPTDRTMAGLADHGITAVPQFVATPGWLSHRTYLPPVHKKRQRAEWSKFLRRVVKRYGRHGTFWSAHPGLPYRPATAFQIWNEQNAPGFFEPKPSPAVYARLLKLSARTIHGVDPNAKIVLGGMFETSGTGGAIYPWKFVGRLYGLGMRSYFDAVGSHPYSSSLSGVRSQVTRLRRAMNRHRDRSTPLWIDEIGWGSARSGSLINKGPRGQARMLKRSFAYFASHRRRLGIGRVYWYPFRDTHYNADTCGFCNSEGLFNRHGKAKPAWKAFKRFSAR
jgi:hypothetical protein